MDDQLMDNVNEFLDDYYNEEEDEIITLEFADGTEEEFEVGPVFEVDGKEYIVLFPLDEEEDGLYVYGFKELEDGEAELSDIEDEDEIERVTAALEELVNDLEEEE